jgi:3-oxoacyl-[acyl-carrier protein] reductase
MSENILNGKNCLITGATGGIGKEIAECLAKKSCNLFLTGRDRKLLSKMRMELERKYNVKIEFQSGDLTKKKELDKIIEKIRESFKNIDILINSTGIFVEKSIEKTSLKDFEECFRINAAIPFLFCKEFSKDMKKKKWGRIVNIGSSSSYTGFKNGSAYCSSKHAVLGLSRSLFNEFKEKNVRVFCISPGSAKTKMGKKCKNQNFETFINPKEIAEYTINLIKFNKEMIIEESRLNRIKIE